MRRTASLLSVTLLAVAAWAEDAPPVVAPPVDPAPAPAPVAEPAPAPAPVAEAPAAPAPVAAPSVDAAPAAAATAVAAPAAGPSSAPLADDVVLINPSRRARPAAAPRPARFGFNVSLGAGYDSNILLENTDTPTATDENGLALFGEVRGQLRLVDGPRGRLAIFGAAEINDYPDVSEAQLIRYGGGITAGGHAGGFDPGLVASYNHFLIDQEAAADAVNVNGYVAKVFESNVAVLGVGAQYVDYVDNEDITGTLYDASYRHWFLLEPSRVNRRVELGIKIGKNDTDNEDFAYTVITPTVAGIYRIGDNKPVFGTQDLSAKVQYEIRRYPDPEAGGDAERQKLLTASAGYDYFLTTWLSLGGYGSYSKRSSTEEVNRYDRFQTGFRLNATW